MTAAEVMAGDMVELACGCIGQRATAPVGTDPSFLVKASCDNHAPNTIVTTKPDDPVIPI